MNPLWVSTDLENDPWMDTDEDDEVGTLERIGLMPQRVLEGRPQVILAARVGTVESNKLIFVQVPWQLFKDAFGLLATGQVVREDMAAHPDAY